MTVKLESILCTTYACRAHGSAAWQVVDEAGHPDEIRNLVIQRFGADAEMRLICTVNRYLPYVGERVASGSAITRGWAYDPALSAWCAPEEPASIAGESLYIDSVSIRVKDIIHGNIELEVRASGKIVPVWLGDTQHTLADFVRLADAAREHRTFRCDFETENNRFIYMHIARASANAMRFSITDLDLVPILDLAADAEVLFECFAKLCKELAQHPCLGFHWVNHAHHDEQQYDQVGDRVESIMDKRYPDTNVLDAVAWENYEREKALLFVELYKPSESETEIVEIERRMLEDLIVHSSYTDASVTAGGRDFCHEPAENSQVESPGVSVETKL